MLENDAVGYWQICDAVCNLGKAVNLTAHNRHIAVSMQISSAFHSQGQLCMCMRRTYTVILL